MCCFDQGMVVICQDVNMLGVCAMHGKSLDARRVDGGNRKMVVQSSRWLSWRHSVFLFPVMLLLSLLSLRAQASLPDFRDIVKSQGPGHCRQIWCQVN